MDSNRNLRIVRTSGPSYPYPYKDNVLWVHHDEDNNPVTKIWDHGKWIPFTGNESGSGDITIDTKMSDSSSNAIANKTVKKYIDGIASKTDASILSLNEGKVDKEQGKGLSKNDYTDEDKAKVRKALQEETDPTVPGWAKAPTKPAYTAKEVGALPDTTKIPTKVSELENDKNYLTEQSLEGYAKAADLSKVATSGKYEDLSGKPTILTESEVQAMINTAVVSAINTEV